MKLFFERDFHTEALINFGMGRAKTRDNMLTESSVDHQSHIKE